MWNFRHFFFSALNASLSKLSCNGETNNTAATTMTSLAKTLMNCAKTVNASCGNQTYTALNSTLVNTCNKLTKDFATAVNKCTADTSNKCTCWNDSKLKSMSKELSSCKSISGPTKNITKQKTTCISAFSKCKVTEDKAVAGLAACLTSTSSLVKGVNQTLCCLLTISTNTSRPRH